MNTYLAKFVLNNKVAYKLGHTKWPNAYKRFEDEQYNVFDDVVILGEIITRHQDARVARNYAKLIEETLKAVYPKNFRLESHFLTEDDKFNGLSGITEMFILKEGQSEEDIVDTFARVKRNVERTLNEETKVYMGNVSERRNTSVS